MVGADQFGMGAGVIGPWEENNTCWTGISDDYPAVMHTEFTVVIYTLFRKVYAKTYLGKVNVVQ